MTRRLPGGKAALAGAPASALDVKPARGHLCAARPRTVGDRARPGPLTIGAGGGKDSGQPSNRRQDGTEAPAPAPQAAINSLTDGGALGWMPAAGNLAWRKP